MLFDLVAIAACLARRGTDAPHDRRKRIRVGQPLKRIFLPGHPRRRLFDAARDVEVAANILPGRAAPLARRSALYVGRALVAVIAVEYLLLPGPVTVIA